MIRILVPLDGSTVAEEALFHACSIARTFPAELVLLRVITESDAGTAIRKDSVDFALWRHQAQAYLDGIRVKYASDGMPIRCEVAEGSPAETIVQVLQQTKPDLLILTRYGRGNAQEFAAGGTVQKIISRADCSVMLLDPRNPVLPETNYRRILVPIDDGKDSDCAVAVATMLAEVHGSSLFLLHVVEEPSPPSGLPASRHVRQLVDQMHRIVRHEAERRLRELAAKIPKSVPVETQVLVSSNAPLAIGSTAEFQNSDLLLLHTPSVAAKSDHGYGMVIQSLIQYSHQPLFILQPSANEGIASNFRSVYLDEPCLQAG